MTSFKTLISAILLFAAKPVFAQPTATPTPTPSLSSITVSGRLNYQAGLEDIAGHAFEPDVCQLDVFKHGDALFFNVAFTTQTGSARANYSFAVPAANMGNFPQGTPKVGVKAENLEDNTALIYRPDGRLSLTAVRPTASITLNLKAWHGGRYIFTTKFHREKLIVIGDQLRFSIHELPFYDVVTRGELVSSARCTLAKPLIP